MDVKVAAKAFSRQGLAHVVLGNMNPHLEICRVDIETGGKHKVQTRENCRNSDVMHGKSTLSSPSSLADETREPG